MTPEEALKINGLYEQIDALKVTNQQLASQEEVKVRLDRIELKLDKLLEQRKTSK